MRAPVTCGSILLLLLATPVAAKDFTIQMKNKGAAGPMVFEPAFVKMAPGDTIHIVPTDKTHDANTVPGMFPAGAAPLVGKVNQPINAKLDKPGIYGIECKTHLSLGMVAVVQVGPATNLAQARLAAGKLPPLAKKRMLPMLASVK